MLSVQNPYADSLAAMTAAANMLENQRNNYEQERLRAGENLYKAGEEEYLRKMDNRGFLAKLFNPSDYTAMVAGNSGYIETPEKVELQGGVGNREQDAILNQMRSELDPTQFKSMMALMGEENPEMSKGIYHGENYKKDKNDVYWTKEYTPSKDNAMMKRANDAYANRKDIDASRNSNLEALDYNNSIDKITLPKEYTGDRSVMASNALAKHQQLYEWAVRNKRHDMIPKIEKSFSETMNNIDKYWRTDNGEKYELYAKEKPARSTGRSQDMTHYEQTIYSGDRKVGTISIPLTDEELRTPGRAKDLFWNELKAQIKAGKYKNGVTLGGSMRKTGTGSDLEKSEIEIGLSREAERAKAFKENKNLSDQQIRDGWGYSEFVTVSKDSGEYFAKDKNGNIYKGNKLTGQYEPVYLDDIPLAFRDRFGGGSSNVAGGGKTQSGSAGSGGGGKGTSSFIHSNK